MKRLCHVFFVLSSLLSLSAHAEIKVELHKDVEAIVVDGEELPLTVLTKRQFTLPDGTNQLVLRVSKLVTKGGEFEKFRSDPVVISFTAKDQHILITPKRDIRFEKEAKEYKSKAKFVLTDESNNRIDSDQKLLPRGPGFTRDYEKELAKFNKKRGIIMHDDTVGFATDTRAVKRTINKEVNSTNNMILMQADFLRMTPAEQKAFLQWAVQNLSS